MATLRNPRQLFSTVLFLLLAGLTGCPSRQPVSDTPAPSAATSPTPAAIAIAPTTAPVQSASPAPTPSSTPNPNLVTVKLYTANDLCDGFVSEPIQVPKRQAMDAAIGKVIAAQRNADFNLVGYRISHTGDGVVTIDLRVAPESKRQIVSLSSCEQLALFGGLRQTLTRNPQWQVKSVVFTERGREIVL
jgi:hypothetical protein